ncbi:MAG: DUF3343 domain-containing protein [bacterium]|nr:DUF3343 domain-containing protein [bacterium]
MDYLLSFDSTQSVLQAEQILIRHGIPIETVPHSAFDHSRCGMAILVEDKWIEVARRSLSEADIAVEIEKVTRQTPLKTEFRD